MPGIMLERSGIVKNFFRPRKEMLFYTPAPKFALRTGEGKPLTIVLGLRCRDGLVLCADQLMSIQGSHKYYEEKISLIDGQGWCIAFGYAGSPLTSKALQKSIEPKLLSLKDEDVNAQNIRIIVDEALGRMFSKKQYGKFDQLLVAVSGKAEPPELFELRPPQRNLLPAENFTCLGVGESPLIRYLGSSVYSRDIDTDLGTNVGIYLVAKAIEFIEYCGGKTNVLVLRSEGVSEWLADSDIAEQRAWMNFYEKEYLLKIIESKQPEY